MEKPKFGDVIYGGYAQGGEPTEEIVVGVGLDGAPDTIPLDAAMTELGRNRYLPPQTAARLSHVVDRLEQLQQVA